MAGHHWPYHVPHNGPLPGAPAMAAMAQMSFLGAGIFCAYVVYDTWRIATQLQIDDYIEGAIQCPGGAGARPALGPTRGIPGNPLGLHSPWVPWLDPTPNAVAVERVSATVRISMIRHLGKFFDVDRFWGQKCEAGIKPTLTVPATSFG